MDNSPSPSMNGELLEMANMSQPLATDLPVEEQVETPNKQRASRSVVVMALAGILLGAVCFYFVSRPALAAAPTEKTQLKVTGTVKIRKL